MPLAYYSLSATAEFWSEHWGQYSVAELLRIARSSPLTELIEHHLRPEGWVLEAGCGVGQYVILLREWGHAAVGADWSFEAVKRGAEAGAPLAVMDLRALAIRDRSVSTYLSLGVVEHDLEGPDGIVAEAARVLSPGGVLLLSVPYWNGVRRLFTSYIVWRSWRARVAGGQFYQFAFTRREVGAFLEAQGFSVGSFHPYDPARILRKAIRALVGGSPSPGNTPTGTVGRAAHASTARGGGARRAFRLRRAFRRLLYTPAMLRLFGHMILAVAIKR